MLPNRWLVLTVVVSGVVVTLAGCRGPAPATSAKYSAEIRRTSFGIPHILAKDEAGIGYGFGYAYAQDNVCMFEEMMVTVRGERSKYFGPDATNGPDVDTGSIKVPNLQSDFFFRMLNAPEHVERAWSHQTAEAKALVSGFVAGFNRHLAELGAQGLPETCRGVPWVQKLTEQDLMRFSRRIAAEGASIEVMQGLVEAAPPGTRTAPLTAFEIDLKASSRTLGSNGAAFGKAATQNGRGLLFGNPHYPWYGSLRYYQLHLTIPGKLDAMGVTFGGLPVVRTGFNQHVAWTHTVNTSGHLAFYALTLDPKDPTKYVVDGQTKAMVKETVTVDVKAADGKVESRSHDFWHSDFGLLVTVPGKLEWSAGKAYALFNPSFENHRMIEGWYAMDRARSTEELERAITGIVGIPWTNTMAADSEGRALYTDVSVVPRVTKEKQEACIAEPYRKLLEDELWVLAASAACVLDAGEGAPQPGIFAGKELPVLTRMDFVQNSNESAWLANPAQPLAGYPSIVSAQDYPQNGRTRIGITQILERLAGKDGLEGNRFDMRNLQQIVLDNRAYFGNLLRDDLLAVCSDKRPVTLEGKPVPVEAACDAFRKWDGKANVDSIGVFVAMKWIRGFAREKDIWAVPFSPQDPVNTPRGLKLKDKAALGKVRLALGRAVLEAQTAGIDVSKPWGEIQFSDFGGARIPMHGGDSGDVYNLIRGKAGEGAIRVRYGSSYIQVVQFEDSGPRAEAFLTYSQSTDPASPHFADQTPRFSKQKWISQPFTEAEIKADPQYRTVKIEE